MEEARSIMAEAETHSNPPIQVFDQVSRMGPQKQHPIADQVELKNLESEAEMQNSAYIRDQRVAGKAGLQLSTTGGVDHPEALT